jgi:hypothetical protein
VNKRVRTLEAAGYLKMVDVKNTEAGFEAIVYELSIRAYLALLLSNVSISDALNKTDETVSANVLAAFVDLL